MSHLHVVDGVLPWWIVLASLAVSSASVLGVLRRHGAGGPESTRFLARAGVIGATLVVVMSLPLGPGVHLSLAPLAGMMLGPAGGFLAAFLANAFLAGLGHGGITAIGVNGLFLGGQAVAGALLFGLLRGSLGARRGAVVASAATLVLAAAGGVVALRALPVAGGAAAVACGHPSHGAFDGHPEAGGAAREPGADRGHDHAHDHDGHARDRAGTPDGPGGGRPGVRWGDALVFVLALAAVAGEAALTASVVGFLSRVREDLIHGGAAPRPRAAGEGA